MAMDARTLLLLHVTSLDDGIRRQRRCFTHLRRLLDANHLPQPGTTAYLACLSGLSEVATLAVRIGELAHDVLDELREPYQGSNGASDLPGGGG